ncbi:MAG: sulfatase-like hydrolase/transferase [Bacteroidetes bacterium]|nr:sulfatase-like hydrolase/transferase [Bacteroidota bacterium]
MRIFIVVIAALLSMSCQKDRRPNIIYIMVDDMGYGDLSCFGRKDYQTPVLDAFAKEGVRLTNAYAACAICTPTRVGFMTGRFPARNPIGLREPLLMDSTDIHIGLDPKTPTISSLLKEAGYSTALIGKWHLGFEPPYLPLNHGFDYFFGITAGGADYVSHHYDGNPTLFENDQPVEEQGYLTDLITNHAIQFLKGEGRTHPFFLSLQYTAPHWPWQKPGDMALPDSVGMKVGGSAEVYAAMVTSLDQNIGRVLSFLKEEDLEDNTIVVFTSDNGGEKFSNMGIYRGGKFQLWEGGIRVPAMVRWPGKITRGTESNQVAVTMDWTATLLKAGGVKLDNLNLDGVDLMPQLMDGASDIARKLYWRVANRTPYAAFTSGSWKYLKEKDTEYLFNLSEDPTESHDLKDEHPERFQKMKSSYDSMNSQMLAPYLFPK